jgi:hypothetical protein
MAWRSFASSRLWSARCFWIFLILRLREPGLPRRRRPINLSPGGFRTDLPQALDAERIDHADRGLVASVAQSSGTPIAWLELLDRCAMEIGPGDRLRVKREQQMVRRPWPARLRTDFRNTPSASLLTQMAPISRTARKCGPILSALAVGQHRDVKEDQGRVPRGLCGELNEISG